MSAAKHTPGVRLRWRKDEPERGLARIGSGPRSSTLRDANGTRFAVVQALSHRRFGAGEWFWVAGWESGVPHRNTCNEGPLTEADAKAAALAYVRAALAKAQGASQ